MKIWLYGVAQCALLTGVTGIQAAHAQDAAAAPATAEANAQGDGLEDIVVSAQRRSERLQDVPIAVTALTGATLAASGIKTTEQLGQITPGLVFSQRQGYGQAVIRGIGTNSVQAGDESSVAIYIDGVYISQMGAQLFNLANIAGIEVLKGPQGTLFGRNATGGAINITTRDPSADPTLELSGSWGTFNERIAKGYASVRLSDTLAIDFAGNYRARDNYLTDLVANKGRGKLEEYGGRMKMVFKPIEPLSMTLIADAYHGDTPQGGLQQIINRNTIAETLGYNTTAGRREITQGVLPSSRTLKQDGLSLQVDYDAGPFKLLSISAYRHNDMHFLINNSGTAAPLGIIDLSQFSTDYSQEFRVVSQTNSPFSWVTGAFYFNNKSSLDPLLSRAGATTPNLATILSTQRTEAFAVFADGTLDIGEHFSITAGARYSDESRTQITRVNGNIIQPNQRPQRKNFSAITPRGVLSYKPTSDILVYASYSQGFKSGVFNPTATTAQPPVDQSDIDAYELGVKTKFGNWATINMSAFRYDYSGLQVSSQVPGGGGVVQLQNAANARIKGADIDANFYLGHGFQIGVGVSYLDAKYLSFPLANVFLPKTTAVPGTGNNSVIRDVSGKDLERSPHWTVNVSPRYELDFGDSRKLNLSGNVYYNDGFYWDPINRVKSKSYVMVNAQAEFKLNEQFSVAVYGQNLTNADVYSTVIEVATGDRAEYQDPRTVGVRLSFKL